MTERDESRRSAAVPRSARGSGKCRPDHGRPLRALYEASGLLHRVLCFALTHQKLAIRTVWLALGKLASK